MNKMTVAGLFTLSLSVFAAGDPFVGTWRLNTDKSKFQSGEPGVIMMATMQIEAHGSGLKSTASAADGAGIASDFTFTCSLDGVPCKVVTASPLRSESAVDTVALTRVNPNTILATGTRGGKPVYSDLRTVSSEGKTLVVVRKGTTPEGKKYETVIVMDRIH